MFLTAEIICGSEFIRDAVSSAHLHWEKDFSRMNSLPQVTFDNPALSINGNKSLSRPVFTVVRPTCYR